MQQRLPSLLDPPIAFAHRGARAHARDNTIESFQLALRLGATGLESDVWVTSDDVVVCDHDGVVRRGPLRRRAIRDLRRDELPAHIPTLTEVLEECGSDFELILDVKDHGRGAEVIATIAEVAPEMLPRLWLCEPQIEQLIALRTIDASVKLVNSVRLHHIEEGPERRAARLADAGIDALNMRQPDWNGGLVTLVHRFGIAAIMWDVQHDHHLRPAFRMGLDGVISDHVDRLVEAFSAEIGN